MIPIWILSYLITNLAKAAIRFEISDAATAALAIAVLLDYGIVKKFNKSQIITEKKIFGEKKESTLS